MPDYSNFPPDTENPGNVKGWDVVRKGLGIFAASSHQKLKADREAQWTWSETPAEFHLQPTSVFRPCGGLAR